MVVTKVTTENKMDNRTKNNKKFRHYLNSKIILTFDAVLICNVGCCSVIKHRIDTLVRKRSLF